ncbi:1206_t:CDS:2 [Ambispora leptoticha]|uniref:1206_t:CDS:1 n=1 Tax=Ambispora leptoticha TaxID=144679 RepID=A0A9N9END3_9GLOM|nr:1206_t:CDS:2 [Ambispora leptoticha]
MKRNDSRSSERARNTFALLHTIEQLEIFNKNLSEELQNEKAPFPCENGVKEQKTLKELNAYNPKTYQNWQDDPEGHDLILESNDFLKEISEITKQEHDNGMPTEKEISQFRYFFEDFSGTIFKAYEAVKKDDKKNLPIINKEKNHQIDLLKAQMEQLKKENKTLRERLANNTQLTDLQREILNSRLTGNNERINKTQRRLDDLQNELKTTEDGKKMNLAVGFAIFAAVVAFISLVVILVRRPRHRDY